MGMGRAPCCEKIGLKKGSWTPAEDLRLMAYIGKHGHGNWRALPKKAGLLRCGKSCRLRWINYLRPDIKRGNFTKEEEDAIIELHQLLGNKWSKIASRLPGRTDNEIKNVWNTHLKKRLNRKGPPPSPPSSGSCSSLCDDMIIIQRDVDHSGGVEPNTNSNAGNNISHMNSIMKEDSSEDDVIEISVLSNVEMWDILEQEDHNSPPNCNPNDNSNNNDMDLWGMQVDKHYAPHQPPTGTSISSTSSNSGITNCTTQVLVDGKCMFGSQVGSMGATTVEEAAATAPLGVEDNTWIEYLERELDLWCANDRSNHQSLMDDLVEPPKMSCEDHVDFDPITSYFQSLPGSLIPF